MNPKIDNPQAFPLNDTQWSIVEKGMDLRDYFAAKAMQGFISTMNPTTSMGGAEDHLAVNSYNIADAMLKTRSK